MNKVYFETNKYRMMSLDSDIDVTHEFLFEKFGYHSDFVKPHESFDVWFNTKKIERLVEDIISNSEFKLLSVSEDANTLRYHFISK